jgi:hypothetical protein
MLVGSLATWQQQTKGCPPAPRGKALSRKAKLAVRFTWTENR